MDKNSLLIEMNEILGYDDQVSELQARTPTPESVARHFQRPGNTLVDNAVLESLAQCQWEDVAQIAGFSLIPEQEVVNLARAMAESTPAFRETWRRLVEQYKLPSDLSRGAFVSACKISPDETVLRRVVGWSKMMVAEADSTVHEKLAKKMPQLAKSCFVPAADVAKQNKEREETQKYMSPHADSTDAPDDKKQVLTPRIFQDPDARDTEREKELKGVEAEIKKLTDLARKAGKEPEEMFPLIWRDLHRERVRFS